MNKEEIKKKVLKYLNSFSNSDTQALYSLLDRDVVFKNIVNNETATETKGIENFINIFKESDSLFESKKKTMITIAVEENLAAVEIFFDGILASDLSESAKKGDSVRIEEFTEFEFSDKGFITSVTDYSS
jgi:archaellin